MQRMGGVFFAGILTAMTANAGPTWLGNGDDGSDLEKLTPIQSGPIFEARAEAVALLKKLSVEGVTGLGTLIPEVEKADLYLAEGDVSAQGGDLNPFHSNMAGKIYARTFPTAHAPTRFYPIAKNLSQDQLVALHIHEALHRSLPLQVRENETTVTTATLAITAPGATFDRIQEVARREWAETDLRDTYSSRDGYRMHVSQNLNPSEPRNAAPLPWHLQYAYTHFQGQYREAGGMQILRGDYRFEDEQSTITVGLTIPMIEMGQTYLGTPTLNGKFQLWGKPEKGAFTILSRLQIAPLGSKAYKDALYSRSTLAVGLGWHRENQRYAFESSLSFTPGGGAGPMDFYQRYASYLKAMTRFALKWGNSSYGVQIEGLRSGGSEASWYQRVHHRTLSVGPEYMYRDGKFGAGLQGKFKIYGSEYQLYGDPLELGYGVAQVQGSVHMFF